MKLKRPQVAIPNDDPFKNDELGRRPHAEILTTFIQSLEDPFVFALEGAWGHGKTTFIRMWMRALQNEGHACFYFNAWEADFSEDPLVPLLGEFSSALTKDTNLSSTTARRLAALKSLGVEVAKRSIPVATKLISAGLIEVEDFAEKTFAQTVESLLQEKFNEYDKDKESLVRFRQSLSDLVTQIATEGRKQPLIFFVDELDRCRPSFAVLLLERLKHLFNVDNVVYVLSLDREQLEEAIRGVYGAGCDAARYLRKFIDMEYRLPDPDPERFVKHLLKFHGLDTAFPTATRDANADKQFSETFSALSQVYGLRLRDQEQALSALSVAWRALRRGEEPNAFVIALLLTLKTADVTLYRRLLGGQASVTKIVEKIAAHPAGEAFLNTPYGVAFKAFAISYAGTEREVAELWEHASKSEANSSAPEEERLRASRILRVLNSSYGKRGFEILVRKLEIAERFTTR